MDICILFFLFIEIICLFVLCMQVIRRVRPDYVMVELDRKRYESMMKSQSVGARGRENPFAFVQQMVQTLANGNIGAMGKLVGIGLSGFYRLLATHGLQPGQEFKVEV
jgi:pheromone shutdown protein TraB